jgi:monofunctional biosynthetic peptidoglycan transglycosylase
LAKKTTKKAKAKVKPIARQGIRPIRWLLRWVQRASIVVGAFFALWILLYAIVNPPTTPYMISESRRLGGIDQIWVPMEEIAPVMARSAVAAEDADFCNHWGFDIKAIRAAIDAGRGGGASTISQQVVKNAYLWHGRSWLRKALEAVLTPATEAVWTKRRILEVYLNIAEFDEGIFGIEAASRHYFGVGPDALTATQAARLAAILPNPKNRSASRPSEYVRNRARSIIDGAATIRADGRSACFED